MGPPRQIAVTEVVSIHAGADKICALHNDGTVSCWRDESAPERVTGLANAVSLAVGGQTVCIVQDSGSIRCLSQDAIVSVAIDDAISIAAGSQHYCAIRRSGDVACWGSLVPGHYDSKRPDMTPVVMSGFPKLRRLALGGWHACGLSTAAEVWCFGANDAGQLGDGSTTDAVKPRRVPGLSGVQTIAADYTLTCATTKTSTKCWGVSEPMSHSDGPRQESQPEAIADAAGMLELAISPRIGCGLKADDSLVCWEEALDSNGSLPRKGTQWQLLKSQ